MKRWMLYAFLVWLVAAAAIFAVHLYWLDQGMLHESFFYSRNPDGRIDDRPAYVFHQFERSVIERSGEPAWRQRNLLMIPAEELTLAPTNPRMHWRAVSIERPFHLTFIKPDGTITGPHRVEIGEPVVGGVRAGWNPDGSRFSLALGFERFSQNSALLEGRFWSKSVVRQIGIEVLGWMLLAGFAAALIARGIFERDDAAAR